MPFERTVTSRGHKYRQLVENHWDPVKQQSRTKVLEHLGPVVKGKNGKEHLSIRIDGVESACMAGHLALFHTVATRLRLHECVDEACPSEDGRVADAVLALVHNQLNGRKPLKAIGPWLDSCPLGAWMGVPGEELTKDVLSSALNRLCTVDGEVTTRRAFAIQRLATEAWQGQFGEDPAHYYFYYDISRIRYNGSRCPLAQNGYGPTAAGRPHVGLGLVTSRGSHFPVMALTVEGSVNDARTFTDMAEGLRAWDLEAVTLILDRGIMNAKSTRHARSAGFHVLGGLAERAKEVKEALRAWPDEEIERSTQVYLRPDEGELYYKAWSGKLFGKEGTLVLTLDPARRTKERGARDRMLYELRHGAKKARANELRRELRGIVVPSKGRRGWTIDEAAEGEARRADGRFLLFTTDPRLEPEEVVRAYHQRDEIEKAFRDLNGRASMSPIRYRLPNHVEPYLTVVCYLAYLERAAISWMLRKARREESVDQAIEVLRGIQEIILVRKGKRIPRWTNLSKTQRALVKVFGLEDLIHSN
jgi:hypothetical protein